jgi:hypothetical protein
MDMNSLANNQVQISDNSLIRVSNGSNYYKRSVPIYDPSAGLALCQLLYTRTGHR